MKVLALSLAVLIILGFVGSILSVSNSIVFAKSDHPSKGNSDHHKQASKKQDSNSKDNNSSGGDSSSSNTNTKKTNSNHKSSNDNHKDKQSSSNHNR